MGDSVVYRLRVESFEYLSQYPNYLLFSGLLVLIGTAYEKLISRFAALRFLRLATRHARQA